MVSALSPHPVYRIENHIQCFQSQWHRAASGLREGPCKANAGHQGSVSLPVDHHGVSKHRYRNNQQPAGSSVFGVAGSFFNQVYRLNRNERVNSRGIEIEVNYSDGAGFVDKVHTHRTWLEMLRSATLTNGMFEIDYA